MRSFIFFWSVLKSEKDCGFAEFIAYEALAKLTIPEIVNKAENAFIGAVKFRNDKAAFEALKVIQHTYGNTCRNLFIEKIIKLYWELAGCKAEISIEDKSQKITMPESRKLIIKEVVQEWFWDSWKFTGGCSKDFCDFIVSVYCSGVNSLQKNSVKLDWESEEAFTARKNARVIFEEEKSFIEKLFREYLNNVPPENIKMWAQEIPYFPSELIEIMSINWARNGGWKELTKK